MVDLPYLDRRTRVIHIITRLDRGGSARNTFLTAMGHDRSTFCVGLVYGCPKTMSANDAALLRSDLQLLHQAGVLVFEVPTLVREINPVSDALATFALWRVFCRERAAGVDAPTPKGGGGGGFAALVGPGARGGHHPPWD